MKNLLTSIKNQISTRWTPERLRELTQKPEFKQVMTDIRFGVSQSAAREDELWSEIVSSLAGRVGLENEGGCGDVEYATKGIRQLISLDKHPTAYSGPLTPDAIFSAADAEAHRLVSDNQAAIAALADALLENRIMYADDIQKFIQSITHMRE